MLNRDLLQSASACRQVLEIVAKILAKRLELWDEQGTFQVTSESFSAAKLWLWSRQGCQTPPGVELNLEELVLARSSRLLEQWNFLANHHPALITLCTVYATIVDDGQDSQATHDYKGFNCGLTSLSGHPTLLVPMLTGATFKSLGWLELEPEPGPSSVEAFFQFVLPAIFSSSNLTRKTHVELSLPCPPKEGLNNFQFFHPITQLHIPLQVDYLRLMFNGYDNVDDVLRAWSLCESVITGVNIMLWVTQLQSAAIDKIILFTDTSVTFNHLTVQGKDNHTRSVNNIVERAHSVKLVPGMKPSSSG
ncbi:hypothetical protein IW261DRAFT_1423545 [Armillaria novae-zelandiae]|uniref:Uncharacterized protein n=1 Tax=Armillaria novae-zelandiae TaxID=153914 RepID=A0AA39NXD9_9AGAR|nr:hypothetical protein IW261DRAFT_1423545 [Armillaria novae-zelandiae]